MKYKLDVKRDVDGCEGDYLLWLPFGFKFFDDEVHVRGFDTIAQIRKAAKTDVVVCECNECIKSIEGFKKLFG
jgi:hypothetical protein